MQVVFDTNTVISALLFSNGRLAWLRTTWNQGYSVPVVCHETAKELLRVLAYPKFQLSPEDQNELLTEFLPYAETFNVNPNSLMSLPICRDKHDQKFLILAQQAKVDYIVTGDADLLVLNNETEFSIITPAEFKKIVENYNP